MNQENPMTDTTVPGASSEGERREALAEIGGDYTILRSTMKGIAGDTTVTSLANARAVAERAIADTRDWMEFDRAALHVAPPSELGLDVLRLARAIEVHRTGKWYDPVYKTDFEEAEGLAAVYADLPDEHEERGR